MRRSISQALFVLLSVLLVQYGPVMAAQDAQVVLSLAAAVGPTKPNILGQNMIFFRAVTAAMYSTKRRMNSILT